MHVYSYIYVLPLDCVLICYSFGTIKDKFIITGSYYITLISGAISRIVNHK